MLAKTIRAGMLNLRSVFCRIEYNNGRLSITGVHGPNRDGNAYGSCGQIVETLKDPAFIPREGFDASRFADVWDHWHLNDLRAGCEHQRQAGVTLVNDPCPTCGYKYGTAWLFEAVPDDVIAWLFSDAVAVTDLTPAWV